MFPRGFSVILHNVLLGIYQLVNGSNVFSDCVIYISHKNQFTIIEGKDVMVLENDQDMTHFMIADSANTYIPSGEGISIEQAKCLVEEVCFISIDFVFV